MQPAATTLAPPSAAASRVSIESRLARSTKPQVLTSTTSASALSVLTCQPSACRRAASSSESTSLRAQPSVSRATLRPAAGEVAVSDTTRGYRSSHLAPPRRPARRPDRRRRSDQLTAQTSTGALTCPAAYQRTAYRGWRRWCRGRARSRRRLRPGENTQRHRTDKAGQTRTNEIMTLIDIIELVGAALILTAFAGAQRGRLDAHSVLYLVLNMVGAGLLTTAAAAHRSWGFLVLEGVWTVVSAVSLSSVLRGFRATGLSSRHRAGRPGRRPARRV